MWSEIAELLDSVSRSLRVFPHGVFFPLCFPISLVIRGIYTDNEAFTHGIKSLFSLTLLSHPCPVSFCINGTSAVSAWHLFSQDANPLLVLRGRSCVHAKNWCDVPNDRAGGGVHIEDADCVQGGSWQEGVLDCSGSFSAGLSKLLIMKTKLDFCFPLFVSGIMPD